MTSTPNLAISISMPIPQQIALLATGDEIITGDIMNTNAPEIAKILTDNHLPIGLHMTASDDQQEIETAIRYLLGHHRVVITIGGLGPTTDDRTRFALSDAIGVPLAFDLPSWEQLTERLMKLGHTVPRTNRYQCLFPEEATIIENPNGTANACRVDLPDQTLFMLPGPPNECLPLFEKAVLTWLLTQGMAKQRYRKSWLLMGIGEGSLASKIDHSCTHSDCQVGYRVEYPYLELKLSCETEKSLEVLTKTVYPHINQYIVNEDRQTASKALCKAIIANQTQLSIADQATRGHLASQLLTQETAEYLQFNENATSDFRITGLDDFWKKSTEKTFSVTLSYQQKEMVLTVPNRGAKSLLYATELLAFEILKSL